MLGRLGYLRKAHSEPGFKMVLGLLAPVQLTQSHNKAFLIFRATERQLLSWTILIRACSGFLFKY